MQLLTIISTIDDLNYPEKTITYYIVNVPYIFSACWKVSPHTHVPCSLCAFCIGLEIFHDALEQDVNDFSSVRSKHEL